MLPPQFFKVRHTIHEHDPGYSALKSHNPMQRAINYKSPYN
jgi:hypothetical protein